MQSKTNFLTTAIVKAMSVFGGVQVVNILCSLVRNKLVAWLIGPAGLGLVSVYNSAIELLSTTTSLGLRNSATRYLAGVANAVAREELVWIVRRWAWIVGIFGCIVTLVLSPLLSYFTFESTHMWWAFALLSAGVLINALTMGELAIMQGTYKLSALARSTIVGNLLGLAAVFPFIYFLREAGVVPMIVSYYVLLGASVWWVSRRKSVYCAGKHVSKSATIEKGKLLLRLGLMLTLSASAAYLFNYVFVLCLKSWGGDSTVGLYQSGYMLVNRYADLVFAAMAVEYFPRLTSTVFSNRRTAMFVQQQIVVTISVLLPLVVLFIPLRDVAIKLLYSSEFLGVSEYIAIAAVGTVFKAVSWCMSFVILAKADGRIYLITEILSNAVGFALSIVGYKWMGINGIAVGYVVWYIIYTIIVGVVYFRHYHLRIAARVLAIVGVAQCIVCASALFALHGNVWAQWGVCFLGFIAGGIVMSRIAKH
ncbi:MAG: oligosaccharide flippase family protein [Muribaculaceae bacterium]|nr:oligosaccharide flippase family protein [Muribaculaceae bacterium]